MAMVQCPECKGDISDKACTCPHCGYPIKETESEQYEYVLSKGERLDSSFPGFLKVLAVLTWIAGMIIAVSGAKVTDSLHSSSFSFAAFITLLIPYAINGIILWGMATLADQIAHTHSLVSGLRLQKKSLSNSNTQASRPGHPAKPISQAWICPQCHYPNRPWEESCTLCGAPKKK